MTKRRAQKIQPQSEFKKMFGVLPTAPVVKGGSVLESETSASSARKVRPPSIRDFFFRVRYGRENFLLSWKKVVQLDPPSIQSLNLIGENVVGLRRR